MMNGLVAGLVAAPCVIALATAPARAQDETVNPRVEPGQWRYTSIVTGLPIPWEDGGEICLTEDDAELEPGELYQLFDLEDYCTLSDTQTTDKSINFNMACNLLGIPLEGPAMFATDDGDELRGRIELTALVGGETPLMTLVGVLQSERLGACAPDNPDGETDQPDAATGEAEDAGEGLR